MRFLIRPPFFYSAEEKNPETRWQNDDDRDVFILHFDEAHKLQRMRGWHIENHPLATEILTLRGNIMTSLLFRKYMLEENYGNWEVMAKTIVDALEKETDLVKALQ